MKVINTLIIVLMTVGMNAAQHNYAEMDTALIQLWKSATEKNRTDCRTDLRDLTSEWQQAKIQIQKIRNSQFDERVFIADTDLMIKGLYISLDSGQMQHIEDLSYQLLWDFSYMRNCLGVHDYPIDRLLRVNLLYKEVHLTVHDQMMQLKYWFEFQDIVDDLVEYWGEYECLSIEEIKVYFTDINKDYHIELKEQFQSCLNNFLSSLASGYRTDFEMPCDEMGDAIRELIWSYSADPINK